MDSPFLCERERHQDADKENGFRKAIKMFLSSQGHGHGALGVCPVYAVSSKASVVGQCPVFLQLCGRVALFALRMLPKQSHSCE